MAKADSTDPVKVAAAMEGLKFKSFNGEVEMRKSDHQLQQPLYITMWQKASGKYTASENTGFTFVPVKQMDPLRLQHADQLPDEAPGLSSRSP